MKIFIEASARRSPYSTYKSSMFHFIRDQFQRMVYCSSRVQSPETESERQSPEKAVCFNVQTYRARTAESRDQSPENDLHNSSSREQNVLRSGFDKPCHNSRDDFCQSSTDMVISLSFHQCHGARASIEGGFFESKKTT